MFIESNFIRCRLSLSHEETAAIHRVLVAREYGGEIRADDLKTIQIFMTALAEHEDKVSEREAQIIEAQLIGFKSAADDVPMEKFTDVKELINRIRKPNVIIDVDEQVGIYQVRKDA